MDSRPLSLLLREATAEAHRLAERHTFVRAMLGGTLDRADYARYLAGLREVYDALEEVLAPASPFADPAVFRTAAIDVDMDALELAGSPTPAAARWAAHLRALPQHGLVGHAYTRYLGDLSGGQLLGQRLVASGMLPLGATHFYRFPQISDISLYKAAFRDNLDQLGATLTADERAEVVSEARRAFEWSAALFDEAAP